MHVLIGKNSSPQSFRGTVTLAEGLVFQSGGGRGSRPCTVHPVEL